MIFRRVSWSSMSAVPWAAISRLDWRQRPFYCFAQLVWFLSYGQRPCGAHRDLTILRWHRAGFQSYWRERSRKSVGRPRISAELLNLIGAMRPSLPILQNLIFGTHRLFLQAHVSAPQAR